MLHMRRLMGRGLLLPNSASSASGVMGARAFSQPLKRIGDEILRQSCIRPVGRIGTILSRRAGGIVSGTLSRFRCYISSSSNVTAGVSAAATSVPNAGARAVSYWLFGCSAMVFGMVVLGGVTRLTRSGLSMVHWRPMGGLPPMSEEAWHDEFERYKEYPEYEKVHLGMSLEEFKRIYMYEWSHRMLGRVIGAAFVVPAAIFAARGYITRAISGKLALMFAMGGAQGLVGWWMVKSGLEPKQYEHELPRVSPYRLAAHLISAFAIYSYMVKTAMEIWSSASPKPRLIGSISPAFRRSAIGVAHLVALTAFSGAFVAGTEAGFVYNEFPYMGGRWIPEDIVNPYLPSKWHNIFENSSLVQFEHRALALASLVGVSSLWAMSRFFQPALPAQTLKACNVLLGTAGLQVTLGIFTLLWFVPVEVAAAHQAGSLSLLTAALWCLHTIRRV